MFVYKRQMRGRIFLLKVTKNHETLLINCDFAIVLYGETDFIKISVNN